MTRLRRYVQAGKERFELDGQTVAHRFVERIIRNSVGKGAKAANIPLAGKQIGADPRQIVFPKDGIMARYLDLPSVGREEEVGGRVAVELPEERREIIVIRLLLRQQLLAEDLLATHTPPYW